MVLFLDFNPEIMCMQFLETLKKFDNNRITDLFALSFTAGELHAIIISCWVILMKFLLLLGFTCNFNIRLFSPRLRKSIDLS